MRNWSGTLPRSIGAALIAMAVACSDEPIEDANTGPISVEELTTLCRGECERDAVCDPTVDVAGCTADCAGRHNDAIRADVIRDFETCMATLPCDGRDDTCESCTPTATHTAYAETCHARLATCGTIADRPCDASGAVCYLRPTVATELLDCLPAGVACADALSCIDAVYRAHGLSPPGGAG